MVVDNEELICIVLRGLPREFAHFCFAIRTRSDPISYEQLAIIRQSEEQAMTDHLDSVSHSLAMFASNGKVSSSTQIKPRIMVLVEEEEEITLIEEEEVVGTITLEEDSHTLVVDSNFSHHHRHLTFLHKDLHISLLKFFLCKTPLKASSMNAQAVKFVENLDMEH